MEDLLWRNTFVKAEFEELWALWHRRDIVETWVGDSFS